jgi:hypothetical protein
VNTTRSGVVFSQWYRRCSASASSDTVEAMFVKLPG